MARQITILVIFLMAILGCGSSTSLVNKITPDILKKQFKKNKQQFKKNVMLLPLVDYSGLEPDTVDQTTSFLAKALQQSPNMIVHQSKKNMFLPSEIKGTEFGMVTPARLIATADKENMHALIISILYPIESINKEKGIWPYKKDHTVFEVTVFLKVVDVINKGLYLTSSESEKIYIPVSKGSGQKKVILDDKLLIKAIQKIFSLQAIKVIRKLAETPWSGRIIALNHNLVVINAGKNVGISVDQMFSVYSRGASINCYDGKTMEILGNKVGLIKVRSLSEKRSKAIIQSGGPFIEGQVVRPFYP